MSVAAVLAARPVLPVHAVVACVLRVIWARSSSTATTAAARAAPMRRMGFHGVLLRVRLVPLLAAAKVLPRHDRPHNSPYNSAALGFELGLPAGPFDDLPLMKVDRVVSRCAVPHCAVQPMMTLDCHVQWLAFDGPAAAGR
jgi:hypothetical protein